MFGTYRQVLRIRGAGSFTAAGLIGRLPISMISLSVVLLETSKGVSYAVAGTISASFAVAAAAGGPVMSGFVDRLGQRRVLPWAAAAYTLFMIALIVALDAGSGLLVTLPLAAGAGMTMPSVGSLVRARWAYVCSDASELHAAYAWESILDEVIFVVGPPLATALVLNVRPEAGLIACIVLLVVGVLWLIPQHATEPPPHAPGKRTGGSAVRSKGMPLLVIVFILVGGVFGSFEVATVAFAAQVGATSATGLLLALYAISSMLAGLVYGALGTPRLHSSRLWKMLALMALVTLGLPLSPNVYVLAGVAFLAGSAVSPVLISGTALVERIVPSSQLTEGITWTITGMALGLAFSVPLSGLIIDSYGARVAYLVTAGCAIAASAVGWLGRQSLRTAEVQALAMAANSTHQA